MGKKINWKIFFAVMMGGIILLPSLMYFSHDVALLKTHFPHLKVQGLEAEIEIKPQRPKGWVGLKEISPYARGAIIVAEDWSFYAHEGVDLEQVKIALEEMVDEQRFRGASTITQQMVKNVYLKDYPLLWRKFHELVLAYKVEQSLSKNRILEIYLNCIEYGPGIYGIRAAAQYYFKKSPAGLNPSESAFLAMLLPSPRRYHVSFKKKSLTSFARERVQKILEKMRMGKVITPEVYAAEIQRGVVFPGN